MGTIDSDTQKDCLLNLAYGAFKDGLTAHLGKMGFDDLGPSFGYVFQLFGPQPTNLRFVADRLGITPQGVRFADRALFYDEGRLFV